MTIERQIFNIDTDTGTWSDSGPSFHGEVLQTRWEVTTVDTGADLAMWLQQRPGDTGNGILVVNDNDVLGADFTRAYRQPQHGSDGAADPADTGAAFGVPIVSAGEHLRVKVTPGGAAVVGTLFVWTGTR